MEYGLDGLVRERERERERFTWLEISAERYNAFNC